MSVSESWNCASFYIPFYCMSDEKDGSCIPQNGKPEHTIGQKWVEHNRQCLLVQTRKQFSITSCIDSEKGVAWSSEALSSATCCQMFHFGGLAPMSFYHLLEH